MYDFSVIFDLDGVLIDSNPYHKISWKMFCDKHKIAVTNDLLERKIFGRTGNEAIPILFNKQIDQDLVQQYTEEIDALYRVSFSAFIKPIDNVIGFLKMLKQENIKTAIATSAPPKNVEFVMAKTDLGQYFEIIVDSTGVIKSKPNPDIYLKAAEMIKQEPKKCIVIEDSLTGIEAAAGAGMKVIGITTTHSKEELSHTDYVINDFSELNMCILNNLVRN